MLLVSINELYSSVVIAKPFDILKFTCCESLYNSPNDAFLPPTKFLLS